jgi:hypothetical protein
MAALFAQVHPLSVPWSHASATTSKEFKVTTSPLCTSRRIGGGTS